MVGMDVGGSVTSHSSFSVSEHVLPVRMNGKAFWGFKKKKRHLHILEFDMRTRGKFVVFPDIGYVRNIVSEISLVNSVNQGVLHLNLGLETGKAAQACSQS